HFPLRTAAPLEDKFDLEKVSRLSEETHTPYVNLHLSPRVDDFSGIAGDTSDPHDAALITQVMIDSTQQAVDRFGAERVIVENVPYHGPGRKEMRPAVEPAAIRRVVETTGCGFLLDISHARLSARNLGMDEYDYLEQMPGERLRELHVTGIGLDQQGRPCDHLPLTDLDWPFVEWVLARIRSGIWAVPWVMSFEYGGIGPKFEWRSDTAVISEQVPRLYALAHSV
ncbi:MAG: DUF692 family protein, partial [Chloroflexi bacterium]|nr:DUF692 family protein [Chloroflexota bacterium]